MGSWIEITGIRKRKKRKETKRDMNETELLNTLGAIGFVDQLHVVHMLNKKLFPWNNMTTLEFRSGRQKQHTQLTWERGGSMYICHPYSSHHHRPNPYPSDRYETPDPPQTWSRYAFMATAQSQFRSFYFRCLFNGVSDCVSPCQNWCPMDQIVKKQVQK